jgi:hypothetical protein
MIFILKVLSGEMYRAHSTGLETSRRCFRKNRPSPNRARALQLKGAISYSNEQMRSKAHSALTAPLVLHHTRIYECAMKQKSFSIDGINIFFNGLLSFFPGRYECCAPFKKGCLKNASIFSNFDGKKWAKCAVNISAAI